MASHGRALDCGSLLPLWPRQPAAEERVWLKTWSRLFRSRLRKLKRQRAAAVQKILIENARRKEALKRGGERDRVQVSLCDLPEAGADFSLLEIDEALTRLAAQDAQAAELVKLRYYTGLTLVDAAQMLEISERTARRLWVYARSFLMEELSPEP
jgi:DNA-directed RNA polymerase specialized sigma24 family protein